MTAECQQVEFASLIPRATEPGLQLLNEFLYWDSEKRPSAQQALKYSFFQINKRGSDAIHVPTLLLAKHQQQQQHQQQIFGRNQTYIDDHVSHTSLNDADHYPKDSPTSYRYIDQYNTNYRHANGIKPPLNNAKLITDTELSPKRNKPENGTNVDLNYLNASLNNNYQAKVLTDAVGSNRQNPFISNFASSNTSDTGFSSIITTRNSDNSSIIQPTDTTNLLKGSTFNNYTKNREHVIDDNQRRNSRNLDQNTYISEKISDIYVNRHIGKLYDNVRGSIYNNKMYNGGGGVGDENEENSNWPQDFIYKNKTFFLHDNKSNNYNENHDSKIYNIFSKQQQQRSFSQKNNIDAKEDDEENSYLMVKMTDSAKKSQRKNIIMREPQHTFEDKELDKLLG